MAFQSRFVRWATATVIGASLSTLAGAQSVIFGSNFDQSSLTQLDYTGDCEVTSDDIAIATLLQLQRLDYTNNDINADGVVNFVDTRLQIESIIRASLLDPTGSKDITTDDIFAIIDAMGTQLGTASSIAADVDLDGDVDLQDLEIILDAELGGTQITDDFDYYSGAALLQEFIGGIADAVDAGIYSEATAQNRAACGGSFASDNWPQPLERHTVSVSRDYPADGEHEKALSIIWPPNHQHEVSQHWPVDCGPAGTFGTGRKCEFEGGAEMWPANHLQQHSIGWEPPDFHSTSQSELWKFIPNHDSAISVTWPADHLRMVSHRWPAGHHGDVSESNTFPDMNSHSVLISNGYTNQNQETSVDWPPSHVETLSDTWAVHQLHNSISWPASHSFSVSQSWPAGTLPQWPPNHNHTVSGSESSPPNLPNSPTLFPEGHSYLTTLRDILGLLP